MEDFSEIKKQIKYGDIPSVAKAVGCSESLVRAVISGERKDNKGIIAALSKLFFQRNEFESSLKH